MRYRLLLLSLLLSAQIMGYADNMMDILRGFRAEAMSSEVIDSVLNATSDERARFRLEYENKQSIFRRSFVADYYLVDTKRGTRTHLSDGPVRDAVLSPNGKYVVYAKGNNLYIYKTDFATEIAITTDANPEIINGISDWLYEEEFDATCMFAFSPDSKLLAFVRLDETEVPTFSWQEYLWKGGVGEPKDSCMLTYPRLRSLRYPKAGEKNATVSVCVYDILYKGIRTMQIGTREDVYIPRIFWTNDIQKGKEVVPGELVIQVLNRDQTSMEVLLGNAKSTVTRPLYKESSKQYFIDYSLIDKWYWLSDNRFVVLSEKDGWRRAYLYSAQGIEQKALTPAGVDVTDVYGVDEGLGVLYYQAAVTPQTRQCFSVSLKRGDVRALTTQEGMNELYFSKDMKRYIHCFQSVDMPNQYALYASKGEKLKTLESNEEVLSAWQQSGIPQKRFFTIETERGDTLNAWMILPQDGEWKEVNGELIEANGKRYPVVVMQYSGPESQRVLNRWKKGFGHYLACQGYVVINADGRGTGCRGRVWRNETYMQLGQKEAEDQISIGNYAASLPFVDGERMTIMGWSYGGFEVLMTMSKKGHPYRCGVAIAPVTDYRLYDTGYTERYMRRPQVNEAGYEGCALPEMADKLTGSLLIVHGLADDNVHAQNTLLYIDRLVQAGKQFEMQLYVDDNHSIRKVNNYEHLHRRIMLFLEKNL